LPKLRFLWVGRTREADLARGIDRYLKRLERYADVAVETAPEAPGSAAKRPEDASRHEGKELLRRLAPRGHHLGLDPEGESLTSEGFARMLESSLTTGGGHVQFVLGGPSGLSAEVRERMERRISLSPMTLTHEMARLFLVEQVYRAFNILRGGPYHR
jgi:23S rRNA (pseudouridine1915-N3)-methyltransferase